MAHVPLWIGDRGSGVTASALAMARAVQAAGAAPTVIGLADAVGLEGPGRHGAVPTVGVRRLAAGGSLNISPGFGRALRRLAPEVVHLHELWTHPAMAAGLAARRLGVPLVLSVHGGLAGWALRHKAWKKRLAESLYVRRLTRGAACAHALNANEYRAMRAYGLQAPVCVVPNGVDLPPPARGSEPAAWRRRIPAEARVVLFIGRIHPIKGLAEFLHAWHAAGAARSGPERWHLVLAGWDEEGHRDELQALAGRLGVADSVHFVGPVFGAEKAASYRSADAFVLPSLSEGLPVVVLEAWAHGLPVLMTDACNLPEGFAAEAAWRLLPEPAPAARALRDFLALPPDRRAELGANGLALVRARFTWERIGAELLAVYRWLVEGGPPPASIVADEHLARRQRAVAARAGGRRRAWAADVRP